MNESYVEILIKRRSQPMHMVIKVGMLVLTVAVFLLGLLVHWLILIPGLFLLVADNFALPLLDVEYEYLYVSGELTIDKIMGKSRRKNCFTGEMDKIELIAPKDSPKLSELGALKYVEKDYTSGRNEKPVYVCVFRGEKEVSRVLFEPDSKMLELMYQTSPRKVVR